MAKRRNPNGIFAGSEPLVEAFDDEAISRRTALKRVYSTAVVGLLFGATAVAPIGCGSIDPSQQYFNYSYYSYYYSNYSDYSYYYNYYSNYYNYSA